MNELEKEEKIITTEDKVKLTIKEYKECQASTAKLWTYFGIALSLLTTLFTAEFKSILGITPEIFKAIFIVLSCLFAVLFFIEAFKIIFYKIKKRGSEEWFILRLQNKELPKKEKIQHDFSFLSFLGRFLQVLLYIFPILLWVLVISLVGWGNTFGAVETSDGSSPAWLLTIFFSLFWFATTYTTLIIYKDIINEWFDDTFIY